jgi:hypothetical protein
VQVSHGLAGAVHWRTSTFLPYDAMTYLVFFPEEDKLGREYEWWTGAMVARPRSP